MEFKIVPVTMPESPKFNYEELKAELTEQLEQYKGLQYTEEQMNKAKSDKASLNKLKKAMNDRRIAIGKEWQNPFNEFKAKVDDLIGMIDEQVKSIDKQVKEFEESEKAKKRAAIAETWTNIENKPEFLELGKIFEESWLNKSVSMKSIKEKMESIVEKYNADMDVIEAQPEYSFEASVTYKMTLDLARAMNEITTRKEEAKRKAEYEEKRRQAEESRRKLLEEQEQLMQKKRDESITDQAQQKAEEPQPQEREKIYHVMLEGDMTMKQAISIKKYCESIGVTLKQVK